MKNYTVVVRCAELRWEALAVPLAKTELSAGPPESAFDFSDNLARSMRVLGRILHEGVSTREAAQGYFDIVKWRDFDPSNSARSDDALAMMRTTPQPLREPSEQEAAAWYRNFEGY